MTKIVKAPLQLEPSLDRFRDIFTKQSYRSFRDLCGALSVCDKSKTVYNLCDTMAECSKGKKARSSYNWFFSDANWDENEIAQRKVDLFIDSLCLGRESLIGLGFFIWTAILLWGIDNPPPKDGSKSRTMGDMVDRVKMQAVGETFEYVMTYFNLPVPDGGLLYILKSLGMKI